MVELPSLSKELDNYLNVEVVSGEVTDELDSHYFAMFGLSEREYANTVPSDLWAFYIKPSLKGMAERFNALGDICVRCLPLPLEGTVVGSFISADGKIPLRLTITRQMFQDDLKFLFFIDTLVQKADR